MTGFDGGLFALPPGVDFAGEFVTGFLHRMKGRKPEDIARVTIYANSNQTITAIAQAFDRHEAMLLPKLRTVINLGVGAAPELGPVAAPLARRLQLAKLIDGLLTRHPELAAAHSLPLFASALTDVMTQMQSEGLTPEALDQIDTADHARHWQDSLTFLKIAAEFYLTGPVIDAAARQRAAAQAAATEWARARDLPDHPIIIAGSTGSHGATRLFMQAVASLPNGAVVLPGFDFCQPDAMWPHLETDADDHPQHRFAPFVSQFGLPRRWTECAPPSTPRNALVSLALRPAPVTDQWIAEGPSLPQLDQACAGLTLIESDQPGTEAEAIALIMRHSIAKEQPITLFSADRGLIRRVLSALDLWHLVPDDSAGRPLDMTAPGLLLRQIAGLFGQDIPADRLLSLLKHPLVATGSDVVEAPAARRLARALELDLRRRGPAFPDGAALRDWGSKGDAERQSWANWLAQFLDAVLPLSAMRQPRPLTELASNLMQLAELLASGPDGAVADSALWKEPAGQKTRAVLDNLKRYAEHGPALSPHDFVSLVHDELSSVQIRDISNPHPLLKIRGPREVRCDGHGIVILSGLNEGQWPQNLSPDPWFSRQMRAQAGLPLPERQMGLAAHDFQQGIAAAEVYLTRSKRNSDAETIPSRWLNRLVNLISGLPEQDGPALIAQMRGRGDLWLARAEALARPQAPYPTAAKRPAPVPPPPPFAELPVTAIQTLIRDPYAVYAKYVLKLRPLNPLRMQPDAARRGQVLHSIVERFLLATTQAEVTPDNLKDALLRSSEAVLAEDVPWPAARAFWRARILSVADQIVQDEANRRRTGQPVIIEKSGSVVLPELGFTLTAKPDRIDLQDDGRAMIYDYKSGTPPSDAQIKLFDKQLILEAAMTRRGGFDSLGPREVAGINYIQLGKEGLTVARKYDAAMEAEAWDGFIHLMAAYLSGASGFTSMRAPEKTRYAGDYDHLARFGEWQLTVAAVPEKVGDHG